MSFSSSKKVYTPSEALGRMRKYCSYQERSHSEVRSKLLELGVRGNDLENVIVKLIEEGFLNEQRFAIAYGGGKFRMKNWGKKKIEQQLKAKGVSDYSIRQAVKEIDDGDYRKSLQQLLQKKATTLKDKNIFTLKQKLSNFLIGKGYERNLVWEEVNKYFKDRVGDS
jgi:regulatory protein